MSRIASPSSVWQRWALASEMGLFKEELIPVHVPQRDPIVVDTDEHPRPDTTIEKLARLRPAFAKDDAGTVTAGNSSGVNDGASALVLMELEQARAMGVPLAVSANTASARSMATMGLVGTRNQKALDRAGLTTGDIDLFELNEAFAAQSHRLRA